MVYIGRGRRSLPGERREPGREGLPSGSKAGHREKETGLWSQPDPVENWLTLALIRLIALSLLLNGCY